MPVETRYFRSDTHTVNTYTLKKLGTSKSGTSGAESVSWQSTKAESAYVRILVSILKEDGTATDVASGAEVNIGTNTTQVLSATIDIPETSLDPTDAILIEVQYSTDAQTWTSLTQTTLGADWVTEQLNTSVLNTSTWTVYYDLSLTNQYNPIKRAYTNMLSFRYDGDYESRIENFTYGEAVAQLTLDFSAPTKSTTTGNIVLGDTVTFSGTLTEGGTPVSGAYIDIIDESTGTPINDPNTIQTDENGNFTYDYTMPTTAGSYSFHAECSDPPATSDTITITVEERAPTLTLTIDAGVAGENTNWHGSLIDTEPEPDYPLAGRTVELYECTDDTCESYTTTDPIATATTNSDGSYSGTFTLPSTPGTYYYQARFPGDTPASVAMGEVQSNVVAVTVTAPKEKTEVKHAYPPSEAKAEIAIEAESSLQFISRNWQIILILSSPFIIYGIYKAIEKMRRK